MVGNTYMTIMANSGANELTAQEILDFNQRFSTY